MESKIDQTSYDETDNAMGEEIRNGEKKVESLGFSRFKRKLDENRRLCKTNYDIPDNCRPMKGDLIEIKRSVYDHWAVYVGDREVIHLCDEGDWKATIKRDLLKDVCGKSLCRINNLGKAAKKRGLRPRSVDNILKAAYKMLNEKSDYHPIDNNCEHFVTSCRFGSRFSEQALAARRDSTGFIEMAAPVAADIIMGTNFIINGFIKTSMNYK
jgi:hypothetical protein